MKPIRLPTLLKALAPACVIAGLLHLLMGLNADVLLGAQVSPLTLNDPTLDSQNRFYGVAFTVYGWLLYVCATDLDRYRPVFRCMLAVFFAAGLARLVSVGLHGWPSWPVIGLGAAELMLPVVLAGWDATALKGRTGLQRA
jgi:Domain of unknown function (DUF4345)